MDLIRAKALLSDIIACVFVKDNKICVTKSGYRGIQCLMESGKDLHGYSVATYKVDKVLAKTYVQIGIKQVYAKNMTAEALACLKQNQIPTSYDNLIEEIGDRTQHIYQMDNIR